MSSSADLAFALHLADTAAAVTMPASGVRQAVTFKADESPVTALDRAAEHAIRTAVRDAFPLDGVLGEEEGLDAGSSGRVWVVDPIDGTRTFAEGIPLWTTLIALREPGGVTAAVVDAPAMRERFTAVRGKGAWLGGRRLRVSEVDVLEQSFVLHAALEEFIGEGRVDGVLELVATARASRGFADAWAYMQVARGAVEAVLESTPSYEWDWAATALIVSEAGGRTSCREGGPPRDGCRLLVTNGKVDDAVRSAFGSRSSDPQTP
jgi:histidinol-phosphatase